MDQTIMNKSGRATISVVVPPIWGEKTDGYQHGRQTHPI